MTKNTNQTRRKFLSNTTISMSGTALAAMGISKSSATELKQINKYSEPIQYGMKRHGINLDLKRAALVVIDPQVDFLSPKGISWPVMGESITENNTVFNIERMFKAAKQKNIPVVVSPHFYFPHDHDWDFGASGEHFMHDTGMFDRRGSLTMEGFENSGADFMPEFKPYIYDGKTIIASPHKIFGPETNDVVLQLRKKKVDQILLAGMAANLCVESHLREFIEQGFEVIVIKDATAGPKIPEGDGYAAALTNYRIIANDLWTTDTAMKKMKVKL